MTPGPALHAAFSAALQIAREQQLGHRSFMRWQRNQSCKEQHAIYAVRLQH